MTEVEDVPGVGDAPAVEGVTGGALVPRPRSSGEPRSRRACPRPAPALLLSLALAQAVVVTADAAGLLGSELLHAVVGVTLLGTCLAALAPLASVGWLLAIAGAGGAHLLAHRTTGAGPDLLLHALQAGVVVAAVARALGRHPQRALAAAFPGVPAALLGRIGAHAATARFGAGDVVVAEGEEAQRFYVIRSGVAEVTALADGREVYLRTLVDGDVFGEVGLMSGGRRTATVRAVSPLEVLTLDASGFRAVAAESDVTAERLNSLLRARSAPVRAREDGTPLPPWTGLAQRALKHPRMRHYNRLIAVVLAANLGLLWYALTAGAWWSGESISLGSLALAAQANLALSVLFRQSFVINLLCWLATRPPPSWPLRIRWALAKFYHFGGLHVGAAVAATAWYVAFVVALVVETARGTAPPLAGVVLSVLVAAVLVVITVMALPRLRAKAHDRFEVTHRLGGWVALALAWVATALLVVGGRGDSSALDALVTDPTVWLLLVTTACVVWPWLLLRKVPVTVDRPSSHAGVVTFHYDASPGEGTTRAISRQPLVGWHQFANIPRQDGAPGHRMVISRAGDWTGEFIDSPPSHVWVRGIPTDELANIGRLFTKVVYVATGSGIAPVLGHLLGAAVPSRLVWVTRTPRATYGDALIDELVQAQPDATIWNTDELGKPDVLRLAYRAYYESGAEAVICVSNPTVTWSLVHELERRGIPAFGPIWDS